MRHIGQEFGFVARSQCQLLRFLFQEALSDFNFIVLALHFCLLNNQKLGFVFKLLIRILKLHLLLLQFFREGLRLHKQFFCTLIRLHRIDHDSDRLCQLIQEGKVNFVELTE
ncbi:hypothetical protein D3C85_1421680 [compost metagenome]